MNWRAGAHFSFDFISEANDRMLSIMHLGNRCMCGIRRKGATIHLGLITIHYKKRNK